MNFNELITQQILMNWIGIVAVLFDRFPINGNAEKLSGNPTVGPHPQPMSEPKVEDTVDLTTDLAQAQRQNSKKELNDIP